MPSFFFRFLTRTHVHTRICLLHLGSNNSHMNFNYLQFIQKPNIPLCNDTNNNNQSWMTPFIYQLHTYPYNPGPRFALIKPCRGGLPVGWVDRGFYRSPVNLRQVFELPRIWYYLRHNTTYYFLYTSKPTQNIQM